MRTQNSNGSVESETADSICCQPLSQPIHRGLATSAAARTVEATAR
jgi:hypothetical protein